MIPYTHYKHFKTVTECNRERTGLDVSLAARESEALALRKRLGVAIQEANILRGKMSYLSKRRQEVCDHPEDDCVMIEIYGFSITTCKVCNKMIKTERDPSKSLFASMSNENSDTK